jgi:hypothetical protein
MMRPDDGPAEVVIGGFASEADGTESIPWEDAAVSFPANLAASWWWSLTSPNSFFERVGFSASFVRPLLYYLLVAVIAAAFTLLWGLAGLDAVALDAIGAEFGLEPGGLLILNFFLSPFQALLVLLVSSLFLHAFALMLAPEHGGLAATGRVFCYGSGPAVLAGLPYIGALLALVWSIVLLVAGMKQAHRTSTGRAAAIVLLPYAIGFFVLILLILVALALKQVLPELPGA